MKAKHLVFHKLADSPGEMSCNSCARKGWDENWRMADVPIHEGKDTFSVVVCSRRCEKTFKRHPEADGFLRSRIAYCEELPRKDVTPEEKAKMEGIMFDVATAMGMKLERVDFKEKGGEP